MKRDALSEHRSEVIHHHINLEAMVDNLVNRHYTGGPSMAFHEEVLAHLSFGFKLGILQRILGPEGKEAVGKLSRLNAIRNQFAHCGVLRYDSSSKESFAQNPRKPGPRVDFDELYLEFVNALADLQRFLIERACREKGAEMLIKRGDHWESLCEDETTDS